MDVYDRLDDLSADTAEARAAHILHGLGFTKEMQQKATKDFSGGNVLIKFTSEFVICLPHIFYYRMLTADKMMNVWLYFIMSMDNISGAILHVVV